jgi:hypothetical protein
MADGTSNKAEGNGHLGILTGNRTLSTAPDKSAGTRKQNWLFITRTGKFPKKIATEAIPFLPEAKPNI